MKKTVSIIVIILLSVLLLNPTVVKADQMPVKGDVYSKYVTVGSEFISTIEVGQNNFSGVVTFDSNLLDFVKIELVYSGSDDVYAGNKGKITNTLNGNSISINYTKGDYPESILITFRVKSYPSNGVANIKVKPSSSQWYGEFSKSINVLKTEDCPTCEKDEVSCPVCEECQKCETSNNAVNNDSNANTNMLLYASLGACGILLVAVVILAIRKK